MTVRDEGAHVSNGLKARLPVQSRHPPATTDARAPTVLASAAALTKARKRALRWDHSVAVAKTNCYDLVHMTR